MIRMCPRSAAAGIALALMIASDVHAVPLTANFGVSMDDAGGTAIDADFTLSPTEHITLMAGAGYSAGSVETVELRGTMLNAGASLYGDRAGVALGYDLFDDSTSYHAGTLGARAWVRAGEFEFTLLARQRDLGVELTLDLPLRTVRREIEFSALGAGLQVAFSRGNFNAYAMTIGYDYDEEFDDFLELSGSPLLDRRPRIEALFGSFLTQTQGAIDRQTGLGVEHGFGRHSLALDLSYVHDAVLDAGSTSVVLTFRRAESARLDWSISAGMADSEAYGGIAFLGGSLGLAN
ncbi:MAG TPA: hypothetical protein VFS58_07395 [Steroidobacteraceae bacterium]|nr:hypothetical protein [Steroidobacteraceae bacterium]